MQPTLAAQRARRTTFSRTIIAINMFAKRSPWQTFWGCVIIALILMAILAPLLAPRDPLIPNTNRMRLSPDSVNWTGTDNIGRDVTSRLIYGARTSLFIAICSVLTGTLVGGVWGLISGYLGGKFDLFSERFVEILLALPGLILAYLLVLVLDANIWTVISALAISRIPTVVRVIRSVALSVRESMYVEAARAIGSMQLRVIWRHIAPQCVAPLIVLITVDIGGVIIAEASLSFLGVGIPPPTPSWGRMLGESNPTLYPMWWLVAFPGMFITLTVLAFNLFGDGVRDALDPRLRGTT